MIAETSALGRILCRIETWKEKGGDRISVAVAEREIGLVERGEKKLPPPPDSDHGVGWLTLTCWGRPEQRWGPDGLVCLSVWG